VDLQTITGLRRWLTRLYLSLRRHSPTPGVTAAHAAAVTTLFDHGPMRMGEFAQRESIRMPSATTLIENLVGKGFVARHPDPDDRRAVLIELTPAGRAAVEETQVQRDATLTAAFESLTPEHKSALAAAVPALQALHARLENHE